MMPCFIVFSISWFQQSLACVCVRSVGLITDQSHNHAIKVEEKHDKVETKLDKGFLMDVSIEHMENKGCLTFLCTFNFLKISVASRRC